MPKVVLDNQDLPPINIKGVTPIRLLRFRIVSNTRNTSSQWSTLFQVAPVEYEWRTISGTNGLVSPVNVTFNAFTKSLTWGPNTMLGNTTAQSTNTTTIQTVNSAGSPLTHNLKTGDEVLIEQAVIPIPGPSTMTVSIAQFAPKRDGVFKILSVGTNTITVDLGPAVVWTGSTPGLPANTKVNFITEVPSSQVDIYLQFKQGSTVINGYSWFYLGTFPSAGTFAIPASYFPPDSANPDTIDVVLQRPTEPKKRYNVNDEHTPTPNTTCPVVLCKMSLLYKQSVTRIGA